MIHEMVYSSVRRFAEHIAIHTQDEKMLSYSDMWHMACRGRSILKSFGNSSFLHLPIAMHIQRFSTGVGLDDIIGVAVEDGPEMVPCLLAILLAGAAFAPIDPDELLDRQAKALETCRVKLIVGRAEDLAALCSAFSCRAVNAETLFDLLEPACDLQGAAAPKFQAHRCSHSILYPPIR